MDIEIVLDSTPKEIELSAKTLEQAIIFAALKHTGQFRKGDNRPYILHPLSVLLTLEKIKKSKNKFLLAVACILHDVVEDCDVTLEEIEEEFGSDVAAIVEELTSDKDAIKEQGKENYLLDKMLHMSSYALCIKLVDRLDNIRSMESMDKKFQKKLIAQTRFILDSLKEQRKLTGTQKKLVTEIRKAIAKAEKK